MMDDYIKRADAVNAVCELALSEEEAEEFAEAIENLPGVEVVPVEDGKPVGFYRPDGPEESEAEHRAEVFERMAFKLGEELDAAKKFIKNALVLVPCGAYLYRDETSDSEYCKDCTKRNSKFVFSAEKAREEE